MGPFYCKKRLPNSVQRTSTSFKSTHLVSPVSKTRTGRRGQQSPPKEGSGGNNSGISRILFKNISGSKEKRKTQIYYSLSTLNHNVLTQSFRMETQKKVRNSIHPKDWAFSLDLTDAYLHVLIHPMSRKYLRFTLNNKIFQFRALPFGLSTSPFVFTQLMTAIASHLHTKAISLFPYLDDWLSRNQNRRLLLQHRQFIIHLISA